VCQRFKELRLEVTQLLPCHFCRPPHLRTGANSTTLIGSSSRRH
jgi:hypothetical protein